MGLMDIFRRRNPEPVNAGVPFSDIAIGANDDSSPSLTFTDKNITFTGDLAGYNYDAILRDKQGNIVTLYQLSDYYVDADPIFRGIIKQVYAPFSVADDYRLVGANEEVKQKYEAYYTRIGLKDVMESIFYQYFKYANVFVYLMPDGRLITLPPHLCRIANVETDGEPLVEFNCREVRENKRQGATAKKDFIDDDEIRTRLAGYPPEVAEGAIAGVEWIQLDPKNTFVLQDAKEDWMRYAVPLIASCLIALRKKALISKWENACLNLGMRSFVHVTYGDPDGKVLPNTQQLTQVMNLFRKAMTGTALAVTNHWAKASFIQPDLDEMFSDDKYRGVNSDILSAGGISGIVVNGRADDGSTFATAQGSMQTAAIRIRKARNNFCLMMNKINRRINDTNSRIIPHSKDENIPDFTFPPVDLSGSKQFQEACYKLWTDGMVSYETLMTAYGLDMDQEYERKRKEKVEGMNEVFVNPEDMMNQGTDYDTEDGNHDGMVAYRRNGRTYWRRNPSRNQTEETTETIGRPTLDDSERASDPAKSMTGRAPKPSNPEGSEAQI